MLELAKSMTSGYKVSLIINGLPLMTTELSKLTKFHWIFNRTFRFLEL